MVNEDFAFILTQSFYCVSCSILDFSGWINAHTVKLELYGCKETQDSKDSQNWDKTDTHIFAMIATDVFMMTDII